MLVCDEGSLDCRELNVLMNHYIIVLERFQLNLKMISLVYQYFCIFDTEIPQT
jgi:hypothetical protein